MRNDAEDRLLSPLAARAICLIALVVFGALHWMQMLDPPAATRGWYAAAIALLVCLGLIGAGRLEGPRRAAAIAATAAAGSALALLGAGLADELLAPGRWDELAAGIVRGVDALPGARVPYRGLDEWLRLVIPLGGMVLTLAAAALAFWPRSGSTPGRPVPALIALVALYAVPSVALSFETESLRGALLALLVLAFLRLERVPRRDGRSAALAAGAAAVLALAVAPALDRIEPWWDYESWALSAAGARSTDFFWDHRYDQPLDWPRDGRELMRVRAEKGTYWKADNLDFFDGRRWERDEESYAQQSDTFFLDLVEIGNTRKWATNVRVSIRNLRTETFVLPGMATSTDIRLPRRAAYSSGRPGIYRTSRALRRGDTYTVSGAYVPEPNTRQLREAGTSYRPELQAFTRLDVVPSEEFENSLEGAHEPGSPRRIFFTGFGSDPLTPEEAELQQAPEGEPTDATRLLQSSGVQRTWALSRRLLAENDTPHEYLRAVQRFLRDGFSYTETPTKESATIDGFLFDGRSGYCQQFSGAMAVLLRMGGIPTRVATGFSAGSYDQDTKEYVVRDYDAHSWVEVWYPGIGWATFDPTPTAAPPRAQAAAEAAATQAIGDIRDLGTATFDPRREGTTAARRWAPWALGAIALVAVAMLLGGRLRRRRGAADAPERGPLQELERALRIAGGGLSPSTTLSALEARFAGGSPAASAYLRALREQRYGPTPNGGPSAAERRALRRALATGNGLGGRARAWWALPPRVRGG